MAAQDTDDVQILEPPPPPPAVILPAVIEIEDKEDGEIDSSSEASKPSSSAGNHEVGPEGDVDSDIEVVADELFEIDTLGANGDFSVMDDSTFNATINQSAGWLSANDTLDITLGIDESPKSANRRNGNCFNCGGCHNLNGCKEPHDAGRIARNRNAYREANRRNEARMHHEISTYTPGKLSTEARLALGLRDDEYAPWIYKMRMLGPVDGYPPGWLKRLFPEAGGLMFHTDDPQLTAKVDKERFTIDRSKIYFYEGFNTIDVQSDAEQKLRRNHMGIKPMSKDNYIRMLTEHVQKLWREKTYADTRDKLRSTEEYRSLNRKRHFDDYESPALEAKKPRQDDPDVIDITDSPASPELPPVISHGLTEDLVTPAAFIVAAFGDDKMPAITNFAKDVLPFKPENVVESTGRFQKLMDDILSAKIDKESKSSTKSDKK